MINTLNVATQGYLPFNTSIAAATLGWLGNIPLGIFIDNNVALWTLSKYGRSWNMSSISEAWNISNQKTIWKLPKEED